MAGPLKDSTILVLEEIRLYLKKKGCQDSKEAALHVVRLVYDDLLVQIPKIEEEKDEFNDEF